MLQLVYTSPTPSCNASDHCEICNGSRSLGTMTFPGNVSFTVCTTCNDNPAKIKAWLIQAFNEALKGNDNFEQLPDGRWQRKQERKVI